MASPMSLLLLSDYVPGILKALQKEYYKQFLNLEVASTREQNTTEFQMGFKLTILRDLAGCSYH